MWARIWGFIRDKFENWLRNWSVAGPGVLAALSGAFVLLFPDQAEDVKRYVQAFGLFVSAIALLNAKGAKTSGTAQFPNREIEDYKALKAMSKKWEGR